MAAQYRCRALRPTDPVSPSALRAFRLPLAPLCRKPLAPPGAMADSGAIDDAPHQRRAA
jgi:hypothetical protein